jgi:uncharacterized protein (DUF433 family)
MTTKTKIATLTPHIWLDDIGRAWIDDTNIKVIEVVLDKMKPERLTADQIYEAHNHYLSLAQIYAAFAYYYDHQAEFDAEIERQSRMVDELRAQSMNSPGRQKLRAMGLIP